MEREWELISIDPHSTDNWHYSGVLRDSLGQTYCFSKVKLQLTGKPKNPTLTTIHDWYVERAKACHIFRVNGLSEEVLKAKFSSLVGLTFQKIDGTERTVPLNLPTEDFHNITYPYFE